MRLSKFISIVCFITIATFLYTHQRIEAVTLSYEIKEKDTDNILFLGRVADPS